MVVDMKEKEMTVVVKSKEAVFRLSLDHHAALSFVPIIHTGSGKD